MKLQCFAKINTVCGTTHAQFERAAANHQVKAEVNLVQETLTKQRTYHHYSVDVHAKINPSLLVRER